MTTIVAPTTANSMFINGIFYNGKNFVNRYNDILENTWVVNCFWTNQNSKFGCNIADLRTNKFCADYGIENKKW
jgi:hypothetical protein